jgi:hypothetical protein
VEPDRVVEVDPAHLGQRLGGVAERGVEVDVGDRLRGLLGLHARRRSGQPTHRGGEMVHAEPHRVDVPVEVVRMEQVLQLGRGG